MILKKAYIFLFFLLSIFSNYAEANTINLTTGVKANVFSNTAVTMSTLNAAGLICNGSAVQFLVTNNEQSFIQDYFIEWSPTNNGTFYSLNNSPALPGVDNPRNNTGTQIPTSDNGPQFITQTFNSGFFGNTFYIRLRYWLDDRINTGVDRTAANAYYTDPIFVQFFPLPDISVASITGNDQTLCLNAPAANLTLSNSTGSKYVWSVSNSYSTGFSSATLSYTVTLTSSTQSPTDITLPSNKIATNVAGIKYYKVTVTNGDGCTAPTKSVIFTVVTKPNTAIQLTSAAGTNTPTLCINNPLTDIVYTTSNATNAYLFSGSLPPGVTLGTYATTATTTTTKYLNTVTGATSSSTITASTTGQIKITGTPTAAGTYTYTIVAVGDCASSTTTGTITVNPDATLDIVTTPGSGTATQTICIRNPITPIVYQSTSSASGVNFISGRLPGGLTGVFSATTRQFIISGTATESGTFPYTIATVGGCLSATQSGTITVKPDNTVTLSSAAGTNSQTICINTAIVSITYTTTGATGATFSNLPGGVSGLWDSNTITISGTATQSGTFTYTVSLTGGCASITATGTIIVNPDMTIGLKSGSGAATQTGLCINTNITPIIYTIGNATGAQIVWDNTNGYSGTPPGTLFYSYNQATKQYTISGTSASVGTYSYTINPTGGCGAASYHGVLSFVQRGIGQVGGSINMCLNSPGTVSYKITNVTNTSTASFTANSPGLSGFTYSYNPATQIITISGTPTQSGVLSFTITSNDVNGCDPNPASWNYTLYVNPLLTSALISGNTTQTICINSPITDIQYQVGNIPVGYESFIGVSSIGLPPGVTGTYTNTIYTIKGTPTVSGIYNYQVNVSGGCNNPQKTGIITVNETKVYLTASYNQNFDNLTTGTISTVFGVNTATVGTLITNSGKSGNGILLNTYIGNTVGVVKTLKEDFTYGTYEIDAKANSGQSDQSFSIFAQSGTWTNSVVGIVSRPYGTNDNDYAVYFMGNQIAAALSPVSSLNWYKIKVTILPNSLKVWIGGILVVDKNDFNNVNNNLFTPSGAIMLGTFENSIYDNLNYYPIDIGSTQCIKTNITPIVYNVETATGAQITSGRLPAGLTGTYSSTSSQFIISGVATESGTFTYTISTIGGCATASTTGTITIKPDSEILLAQGSTATQTICINNAITPIVYNTNFTNYAELSGGSLPAGVGWTYSATTHQLTISGVATQSGTFTYTVTAYGDCASATTTGTITIKPDATINLITGVATQTVCINSPITTVVYQSTSSAAQNNGIYIIAGSLPGGITGTYSNTTKQFTISGIATQAGTFTYTIATAGDCVTATTTGTITIDPASTLSITAGTSTQTICIFTPLTPIVYQGTYTVNNVYMLLGNLPAGITGTYSATTKQFTISGTPTQSGTFTYTIATNGSCATSTYTGTIVVNPINTITPTTSRSATTCINVGITPISYNTTGATDAIYTYLDQNNVSHNGLPAGLTATSPITAGTVTISGTPTVAGTYTYTVTLIGGCGSGTVSASGQIFVNPNNTITLSSEVGTNNQTSVCINTAINSITYSTTGATGATISYSTGTGTFTSVTGLSFTFNAATNVASITGAPATAGNYDYTITLTGGCGNNITATGRIYVLPNKTISIASGNITQTICINAAISPITYNYANGTNARVDWLPSSNGIIYNASNNVLTISGAPSVAGTYNYVVTLDGCGSATATGTIISKANTLTLISGGGQGSSACVNAQIDPIIYLVDGASTFNITGLPAGFGYTYSATTKQLIISGTSTGTGVINYTIVTLDGCGSATTNGTINISTSNTISLTTASTTTQQTVCINQPIAQITYTTSGATGAAFSYSIGAGTYSGMPPGITGYGWNNNTISITGTPTVAGLYTYHIALYGGCNGGVVDGTIDVKVNTITSTTSTDATTCVNTAITNIVYNTTGATGAVYSYTDINNVVHNGLPSGLIGTNPDQNGVVLITGTPTMTGVFRYKITLTGGCGSGTVYANGIITVNPENTIALTSPVGTDNQASVCINTGIATITYANTGATGYHSSYVSGGVTYDGLNNGVLPPGLQATWSGGILTISGKPNLPGTYNYTITQTGGCFPQSRSGIIVVNPDTQITLSSAVGTNNQAPLCINTAITSINYSTTSATSVVISSGRLPNGVSQVFDQVNQTYRISGTPTESGVFSFTILATGNCVSATTNATITVKPNATISLTSGTATNTICINKAIVTPIVYSTTFANSVSLIGNLPTGVLATIDNTTKQLTISGTATQFGTFTYTVVAQGDCASASTTGTITVKPDVAIALNSGTSTQTICINRVLTNIVYDISNETGLISLSTQFPAGVTGTYSATTHQFIISGTPTQSGTFTYTITAIGACATATASGTITVNPDATITLVGGTATNTICINNPLITPVVYRTTTSATEIRIVAGSLPGGLTGIYSPTTLQFTISGTATQSGTFTYTIATFGGCVTSSTTGTITVKPDTQIALTSSPTTNAQAICINTLLTNITYATQNANTVTIPSLPPGINYTFSATTQLVTISGVPTQSGTFTYTIIAYGDCLSATTTGTITVKPDATITLVGGTATNTICINNPLPTIVKYRSTSSTTDIHIIAGRLPGGLVPNYNPLTQEYTISGVATESGTFTYTIATFGDCVTATTTGTITVKPDTQIALTSSPTTNAQAICINTLLTNITYTTQNANTVTIPSLPPGINYTFSATTQLVTISGVPTQSGTFTYTIIAYGDCLSKTTTGTITVKPDATITLVGGTATNTICINNPLPTIVKYRSTSSTTDIHIIAGRLPGGLVPNYNPLTQEYTISGVATESGTFTYTIATFGDCVTATTTGTITVKPDTQIGITSGVNSNNPSLCINTILTNIRYGTQNANTVSITGLPGGISYTFSSTTQSVVISGTPTQSGTFTYTVVAYGDCLSATTTGTITVNENFINLRRPITETCINTPLTTIVYDILYADAATLTGNLPFGVTWTYSTTTRQLSISGVPTNSGVFTYTITTVGGCATKTVTASMTVNPDNTITLTSVPSSTTQVVGINTPIVDIVYLTTGATNVRALNLPRNIQQSYDAQTHVFRIFGTSNEAGTLTYTVVLDGGCGVISTTGSLDIKPNNTITLSSTTGAEACINIANVNVVYKTTLATGATITNTLPTGLTGHWLVRGADSLYVISGIPTQAGTFNYTITLTGGYGNITMQGTLLIDPTTVAGNIASSASIICNNTTPPTISVSGNVGNTFKWQSSTDGITYTDISPAQTNSSISSTVNNAAPGSTQVTTYYKVIVQSGVCPSQITNPVTIKVDPTSQVGAIAAIQKIQEWCINSPAMAVTIPTNVGNIVWQTASSLTGPFTTINGQTGNTLPSNRIPTTAPGVLYYKAVVTSGVCPAINSDIVKVTTDAATVPGNVYFLKGSSPICNNGDKPTVSITNNVGDNIVWQVSGSTSTSVPISTLSYANTTQTGNLLNSAIDNTAPGVNSNFKYYRAAVKNGVCNVEYTQPIELEVIPTPVVTSAISNERCGPGTVKLLGVSNLGEVNWFDATTGGTAIGVGGIFVTPVISETTNYYAGGLYRGCASVSRLLAVAKVKEVPTITTVTSASNCGPATLNLNAVQSSGVINWFADEIGGNSINATQNYTTPLLKKTTTYYVEATLNGCTTVNRTPVIATIFEVPVVKPLAEPVSLCIGKKISLSNNASLGLPPYSYTIYLDNDNLIGQTDGTIIGVKDGATNVYFNVKDKNGCVSLNSNTFKITTFQPIPSQSFNYQAYYLDNFIIPTKKDTGYVMYNWQPPMYLNSYTKADPTFNSAFTTDYILVRTDTTTKCTVADSYHIDVTKDFIFDLPNAFTPNGDGLNDVIKPEANAGIESLHLMIFNRSGKLIFETKDKNEGWDGKYGQVLQDADVYYWIVDYVTKAGQQRKKSGSFLLLK